VFLLFLGASGLIQGSHTFYYSYAGLHWGRQGIDAALRKQLRAGGDRGAHLGEVEAAREVVAVRVEDGDPEIRVGLEGAERLGQLAQHRRGERVALRGPVEADEEHAPPHVGGDRGLVHRVQCRAGRTPAQGVACQGTSVAVRTKLPARAPYPSTKTK
jgi:hypothetical protein